MAQKHIASVASGFRHPESCVGDLSFARTVKVPERLAVRMERRTKAKGAAKRSSLGKLSFTSGRFLDPPAWFRREVFFRDASARVGASTLVRLLAAE
jgi:hypothetical protein